MALEGVLLSKWTRIEPAELWLTAGLSACA